MYVVIHTTNSHFYIPLKVVMTANLWVNMSYMSLCMSVSSCQYILYIFLLGVQGTIKIKQMPADAPFKDYQPFSPYC